MDKIAVLIPCYNEEKTIEKVVRDAKRALAVVRNEYMQGKGNVIRRMFREIDAQCYIMVDGDDTYPLEDAPKMVDLVLSKGSDMVVGDRLSSTYFTQNKRPFHNFGNSLVRSSINRLFGSSIKDIMTGYRAFSYDFVKTFPEMTIHAVCNNMQIDNVIIGYRDRPEGSVSKLNTFGDGFKVLGTIFNLTRNYKPFAFFGFFAAILAVISVLFFIPVFRDYLTTGLVAKFPTLIVCGFVMMAAIQSFFSGMILSNMQKNVRREFEVQRNLLHRDYVEGLKETEERK